MKLCSRCLRRRPSKFFYKNRSSLDNLSTYCCDCSRSNGDHPKPVSGSKASPIKRCSRCKERKPLYLFTAQKSKGWFSSMCRACLYRKRHPDLSEETLLNRIKWLEWNAKKKATGVCTRCGKNPLFTSSSCLNCIESRRLAAMTERGRRQKLGLCIRCGKLPSDRKSVCNPCHITTTDRKKGQKRNLRERVVTYLGGKCECCSESIPLLLNVDHINGGGKYERTSNKVKRMYLQILAGERPDLRLLCFNCNMGRNLNGGVCPHKTVDTK